jgi:signal transduction histidine kinase
MSYRSIKRVLGETSLERKCRFLFGGCLFVLITASFWFYGMKTERLVYEQKDETCKLLAEHAMISEHFLRWPTEKEKPDGKNWDKGRDELVETLTKKLSTEKYEWGFLKLNDNDNELRDPRPPADAFEIDVRDKFLRLGPVRSANPDDEVVGRLIPERNQYVYYQAVRADNESCIFCHFPTLGGSGIDTIGTGRSLAGNDIPGKVLYAVGDVIGIAKVTISNGPTQKALAINRGLLLATAISTVFLAMVASYLIVRYVIVKPLRHLRDVSDAISHGNIALRAEIHTGDEFESLALAFNRMLRHLVTVQEELRHVNSDLDTKVDELAQANMRLYEMNRIKSDFLATMSHELRTPLNSILGFSDVLRSIESLDEKQQRYVQNIQKSGRMLLEMINDILDLAKIESGKMDVRLTDFRIEQVIAAQCDMARPLAERKNIDLQAQFPPDLPPMHQDQARAQQVLNNLLSNAIKFTPEGGRIKVVAHRDDYDYLVLQVIDTGVGIAEEDQQAIFEKFRQARSGLASGDAMTREYSGTGLGLSIVKELCRLLGGEVSVESTLGKGSTFTVRLPWKLEEQPRLDSPAVEGFEEFSKSRLEYQRNRDDAPTAPQATG